MGFVLTFVILVQSEFSILEDLPMTYFETESLCEETRNNDMIKRSYLSDIEDEIYLICIPINNISYEEQNDVGI